MMYFWKSTNQAIANDKTDPLWVIIDCPWASCGFNSEQATNYCLDGSRDKVLYVYSIVRHGEKTNKRPSSETVNVEYEGTSRGMEGHGIRNVLRKCKRDGLVMEFYSHDDSCTRKVFSELLTLDMPQKT